MNAQSLLRWSAVSAGLGGVLFAVYDIYASVISSPEGFSDATVIGLAILMLGGLLVLLGFPGIYVAQHRESGWLGLLGYLLSFLGIALFFAFAWGGVTIAPEIADEATTFISAGPESSLSQFLFVSGRQMLAAVGILLFAAGTLRARVFTPWGPILLILGGAIGALAAFGIADVLPFGEIALAGLGFAVLGFELLGKAANVVSNGDVTGHSVSA